MKKILLKQFYYSFLRFIIIGDYFAVVVNVGFVIFFLIKNIPYMYILCFVLYNNIKLSQTLLVIDTHKYSQPYLTFSHSRCTPLETKSFVIASVNLTDLTALLH